MMDSDQDSNQDEAPSWGSAAAPEEPRRAAGREAPRGPPELRRTLEQERAASPALDGPRRRSPRYLDANLNEAFPWDEAQDRAAPPRYAAQHRHADPLNWDQDQRDLRYWDQAPAAGSLRVDQEGERGDPRDWRLDPEPAASPPRVPGQRGGSPQLRARRRLFSCPSGARGSTAGADVRQQLRSVAERDRLKWNFDFESEQPLPGGDFAWEAVPAASVCAFYRPVNLRRAGKRVSDNVAAAASSSSSSSSCPPRVSSSSSASSSSSSSSSSPSSATVSPEPSGPGPGPPSSREASRGGRGGVGGDGGGGGVGDATGSPAGRECSVTCVPRKRSKLSGSRRRANPALCASRTASPAARGSTT
ncbi:uncharacterized protein LOC116952310 [Petromyzon marinus]|uniref:Serine/arginine repetitive matrix protein 2-like n=1 Tax=Petromyzon marinus TaxID=7757 RepID=A0AAJ7XBS9_PETMA|nr:serine/arginine repetitive matrix protein 2-like [Petromyzon marinus]